MKNLSVSSYRQLFLSMLCMILITNTDAQSKIGIKKINVWADFAFASPKNELKNYYGLGNAMQLYYGVDVPFAFVQYNKKTNLGLSIAGFLDHEKANFSSNNFTTDGLDAKLTSVGVRVRPLANMTIHTHKGNVEPTQLNVEVAELSNIFTKVLSGLYFDFGATHAALIEKPTPDVFRTATMFSYGCAPALAIGKKTTFYIDLGIRKYSWTNSLNTKSSIGSFHAGFGLGFNL